MLFLRRISCVLAPLAALSLAACGSSPASATGDSGGTGGSDGGSLEAGGDDAAVGTDALPPPPDGPFSMAPHPAQPTVVSEGGSVLATPKVVPIYYTGTSIEADTQTFLSELAASSYWNEAVSEYGVGKLTIQPALHMAGAAPASTNDATVTKFLTDGFAAGSPGFGSPDPSAIYLFVIPAGVAFTDFASGKACTDFDGYHGELTVGSTNISYAIAVECPGFDGPDVPDFDALTSVITHELAEAATDPFVDATPAGYSHEDDAHGVWMLELGGEVGDMCSQISKSDIHVPGITHMVQRIWSNNEARANRNPCVPVPAGEIYFNSDAVMTDDVVLTDQNGTKQKTKGVKIPVGSTKTIDVQLWSTALTSGPWTVKVFDGNDWAGTGTPNLAVSIDRNVGWNGDVLRLTIKVLSANRTVGGEPFVIESTLGTVKHYSYGAVGQ